MNLKEIFTSKWMKVLIPLISVLIIIGLSAKYLDVKNKEVSHLNISYVEVVDYLPGDFTMKSEKLLSGEVQDVGLNDDRNIMLTIRGDKKDISLAMLTVFVEQALTEDLVNTILHFLDIFFPDNLEDVSRLVTSVMYNDSISDQTKLEVYGDRQIIVTRSKDPSVLVIMVVPTVE